MRVQKIILANQDIFKIDPTAIHSEMDAVQKIASMECKGSDPQIHGFKIRQTHTAICNLFSLGFRGLAVDLAIDLIQEAEVTQNYFVAQDLCGHLISHYYLLGDISSAHIYKSLYDTFTLNISKEHDSMILYGKAIENKKKLPTLNIEETEPLLNTIKLKMPTDPLWYHYYYFQFNSFLLTGKDLEQLYLDAIAYFDSIFYKHQEFIASFSEDLIQYYLNNNMPDKAEDRLKLIEPGTHFWFKCHHMYVVFLLQNNDLKSNDICVLTMEHPHFKNLSHDLKEAWRSVYKASVRLLLER